MQPSAIPTTVASAGPVNALRPVLRVDQDPGPPAPVPDPSGPCHPEGDPDMTPDGPGDSRSSAPGCLPCQGHRGRTTSGNGPVQMNGHQVSRPGGRSRYTDRHAHAHQQHRAVRGRVQHHRCAPAGRDRPRPHPRRGPATTRRHADLLRPAGTRDREHLSRSTAPKPSRTTRARPGTASPGSTPAPRPHRHRQPLTSTAAGAATDGQR